ncbi:MAG: NAD(P)/FAD-dependent oxidoreductase [Desertifilum sp.]|nr:NAD(P)/FAD-dependent oxidoreductase [Desertifilum sp.]
MTVDYDLVVIGGSAAGVYAALFAAQLKARVALVEPPAIDRHSDLGSGYRYCLSEVNRMASYAVQLQQWEMPEALADFDLDFAQVNHWAQIAADTLAESASPAVLAAKGIDVIRGVGQFCRRPHLAFEVQEADGYGSIRRLRAGAYLLAPEMRADPPEIEGIETTGYLTLSGLRQLQQLPQTLAIVGGDPVGVELAQSLARLGTRVTLIVRSPQILAKEDPEASQLLQALLEAEGVCVLTQAEAIHAREIAGKKWIQAGNKAIETDEILWVTGQTPNVEQLNLEGVGVRWHRHYIQTNQKLQTTHPRIYACGDAVGGYRFAHLATYEASVAVKNALFWPRWTVDYRAIPWAIFTQPQLARVGMTEVQARRRYGKDVLVVRHYFKQVSAAVLQGETTGFCKLIGRANGEILGASIVGVAAAEFVGAIALAMRHKIKVGAIAQLPQISPTASEIIFQTAQAWRQQRFAQNRTWQNLLESYFNIRRSWRS